MECVSIHHQSAKGFPDGTMETHVRTIVIYREGPARLEMTVTLIIGLVIGMLIVRSLKTESHHVPVYSAGPPAIGKTPVRSGLKQKRSTAGVLTVLAEDMKCPNALLH